MSKSAKDNKTLVRVMCIILCALLAGGSIVSVIISLMGGF